MQLHKLKDSELLSQIKTYVQSERELLVKILHHLREIERRRLFSDLGYSSLFEYAVGELNYSEGQAIRRIQSMRLLKELPSIEPKIATGALSLSNIQKAHVFFREAQAADPTRIVTPEEKLDVLEKLEHKSVRDAEKELLRINPKHALPKERECAVSETQAEVRFLMNDTLKAKLEGVRSLLGTKGATMSYAELFEAMSDLSLAALEAKKFGKKRLQEMKETETKKSPNAPVSPPTPAAKPNHSRSISKALKHRVWRRDNGTCTNCGTRKNLNYDHIQPFALGGPTTLTNLRLLCFQCNQRASIKIFGEKNLKTSSASDKTAPNRTNSGMSG